MGQILDGAFFFCSEKGILVYIIIITLCEERGRECIGCGDMAAGT